MPAARGLLPDRLLLAAACAVVLGGLAHTALRARQYDLRTYRYAAQAARAGGNPYALEDLSAVAGRPVRLPYVYPPLSLPLFAPLARLPWRAASAVYLLLQAAAAVGLFALWRRLFPAVRRRPGLAALVLALGYDGALLTDLAVGNISILEQGVLWGAVLLMVRGRPAAGAVLVGTGSALFKQAGAAAVLLPLALAVPRRQALRAAAAGAAGFAAVHAVGWLTDPAGSRAFLGALAGLGGRGRYNPSLAAALQEAAGALLPGVRGAWVAAYGAAALAVAGAAAAAWRRTGRDDIPRRLCILSLAAALLLPRMKDYAHLLTVPAAVHVLTTVVPRPPWRAALAALLLVPLAPYQSLLVNALLLACLLPPAAETPTPCRSPRTPAPA